MDFLQLAPFKTTLTDNKFELVDSVNCEQESETTVFCSARTDNTSFVNAGLIINNCALGALVVNTDGKENNHPNADFFPVYCINCLPNFRPSIFKNQIHSCIPTVNNSTEGVTPVNLGITNECRQSNSVNYAYLIDNGEINFDRVRRH